MRYHKFAMRTLSFIAGVYYFRHKVLNMDYKNYLGPDWKPSDRIPSTYIANHSFWVDILMMWQVKHYPIFTAKSAVRKFPMIGYIAAYPGYATVFVNRAGSKEERLDLVKIMGEH